MLDNEFPMTLNNSVLTPLHCKALSSGSNSMIAILCGGIVTTVDVFSLIPGSLITKSTLMLIIWRISFFYVVWVGNISIGLCWYQFPALVSQVRNTIMVPIDTYSLVLSKSMPNRSGCLSFWHMINMCSNCLLIISNVTFTTPLGHQLLLSTCPTHNCISAICALFDIWL